MSKVLHPQQLPTRLPIVTTLVAYMALDMYDAPGWLWGVVGTLGLCAWCAVVYSIRKEDHTKICELSDDRNA